ncbi:hypothetical protein HPP92_007274 [Vanilla planifolia]|uniref:noroxomaritidine synthase n=1 Tax=Vanilla planifolia TaxID=51239 RepID=A0A835RLL9_VANPL|nr:hypothetical protein HPP92_007274 [Vanilla planifolia]
MDSSSGFWSVFFISILCLLFFFLLHRRDRGNRHLPTIWPFLGMLPALVVNVHRLHDFFTEVLGATGCTFVFHGPWFSSMKFFVTCDPANVNHVFNANFRNFPKGPGFSEIFDILGDGIFNADDESWLSQRRKAQLLMAQPRFRAFVLRCSREKVENGLLPLLRRVSEEGSTVDLQDVFLRLTFDITCNLVFGVDPVSLSPEFPTIPFAKAMDEAMAAILHRHTLPSTWWKLMRRFMLGRERSLANAWLVIDEFISESIAKSKGQFFSEGSDDLLSAYIQDSAVTGNSSDKFLRDTTVNLMLAGRDTTGSALSWFFYLLCENQSIEAKVLDEIRKTKEPTGQGNELVYLHAALCEALRLYPPVPFESKGVAKGEMMPSGKRVEPGMQVLFSTYSMARMERIWGKDCLQFRPERWINEKGAVRHEPAYKFMAFNCGPRTCLGKEVAFTQLKTVAAAVLKEFRVVVVEGHVVAPAASIILHMRNGLKVKVTRRDENI